MRLPPFNPYIAVIIGVLAISTTSVLVKVAGNAPVAIIANYRLFLAFLIMIPIILVKHRHEFKLIQRNDWFFSIIAGLFLALFFLLWFESLRYTSVANSVVIKTLQPIIAVIGAYIFFKERFSSGAIISMFIALLGGSIIILGDFRVGGMAFFGDILALLGAITISIYYLLGLKVRRRLSLMTYTFIVYGIGSTALFFYNIILNNSFTSYPVNYWWVFLALAIFPTFMGHNLFNWALKWLNSSFIALGSAFESVGASVLAFFILKEQISSSQWLGGTIIIFGLFLFIVSTSRKRKVTISQNNWS